MQFSSAVQMFVLGVVVVVLVGCLTSSEARTLHRLEAGPPTAVRRSHPPANSLYNRQSEIAKAKEPSLFELLVDVLRKSEEEEEEGGDGEKRNNFKQAKPCYWSLVSCY